MPLISVNDIGKYGMVKDRSEHHLPPEAWSAVDNWRTKGKAMERFTGEIAVLGTPTVDPMFMLYWDDLTNRWWIYGDSLKLYRTSNGTDHTEVTRTSIDYSGNPSVIWSGDVLGGVPILNNNSGGDYPQQWDGSANFKDLVNWPETTYCKVIRVFKQYLIAINMTEGGIDYPTKLRWSTPADPGTVPTTWVAAATNNAGDYSFSESQGEVVDGLSMGDFFVVYKSDATWLMRLTESGFVFNTTHVFKNLGILAYGCAVEFKRKHFVVTKGDVIVHDGAQTKSVIDDLNRDWLFSQIDTDYVYKCRVQLNLAESEIWVMYPTVGSEGLLTHALVWAWNEGTWTRRELDDVANAAIGIVVEDVEPTIDELTYAIDSMEWPIDRYFQTLAAYEMVLCKTGANRAFYQVDKTYQFNGEDFTSTLERVGLAIAGKTRAGEIVVSPETVKHLRELYPRVQATPGAVLKVQLGSQMRFGEDVVWGDVQEFTVGTDRKLDVDLSFVYLAIRFIVDSNVMVTLDGYDLLLETVGRY